MTKGENENADRKEYRERKRENDGGRRSKLCQQHIVMRREVGE